MKISRKLVSVVFLSAFIMVAMVLNCYIENTDNPLYPDSPHYIRPAMSFDSLVLSDGDTITVDSLSLTVKGNFADNYFRWRIENPSDSTYWTEWTGKGELTYTITIINIEAGIHRLHIQTAYHLNSDITDTTITFVKVTVPRVITQSDTLIQTVVWKSCTLWVNAVGTEMLAYQWYKDTGAITNGTNDSLIRDSLTLTDSGLYHCIVSNSWGSDTCNPIHVEIDSLFRVIYDNNGASGGNIPIDTSYYKYNDTAMILANTGTLEKTGYIFAGWNTLSNGQGTDYASGSLLFIDSTDVILFAKWTINHYEVAFDSRGGTAVPSQNVAHGSLVTIPTIPIKTGFGFGGWYKDSTMVGAWDFNTETVNANVVLYAKWTKNQYTVTFDSRKGSAIPSQKVLHGSGITITETPIKTGYSFLGWYKDSTGLTLWDFTTEKVSRDVTLYAKWTINQYTVTFDTKGGSAISEQTVSYGAKVTEPLTPIKPMYAFERWFKDSECTIPWDFGKDIVVDTVTIHAKWIIIPTYTVTYHTNGSTGGIVPIDPKTYQTGDSVTVLNNTGFLLKIGHTFAEWNKAEDGSGISHPVASKFAMGSVNITLYAQWTINQYSVIYNGNGSTSGTVPAASLHNYKTRVEVSTNSGQLKKTGCTFSGWNTSSDSNGIPYIPPVTISIDTSDIILYAMWTAIQCTVNFIAGSNGTINGQPKVTQIITYGSDCATVTANALDEYQFTQWTGDRTSTINPLIIQKVTSNMNIKANFIFEADFYVDAISGDDILNDGTWQKPFQTITRTVNVAPDNATIHVLPGIYNKDLGETFPIQLKWEQSLIGDVLHKGCGQDSTIINGWGRDPSEYDDYDSCSIESGKKIAGFAVKGPEDSGSCSVYMDQQPIKVDNNTFVGGSIGVYIYHNGPNEGDTIQSNDFILTQTGIFSRARSPVIIDNIFSNPFENSFAIICHNEGETVRDNIFRCVNGILLAADEYDDNIDLGTSTDPGNNDFTLVSGIIIKILETPNPPEPINALGNIWPSSEPDCYQEIVFGDSVTASIVFGTGESENCSSEGQR